MKKNEIGRLLQFNLYTKEHDGKRLMTVYALIHSRIIVSPLAASRYIHSFGRMAASQWSRHSRCMWHRVGLIKICIALGHVRMCVIASMTSSFVRIFMRGMA